MAEPQIEALPATVFESPAEAAKEIAAELPPKPPSLFTQSVWWHGIWIPSQNYGPTDFVGEPFNPHHPQYPHWHDGIDFPMPLGTPIFAGRDCFVVSVGLNEFGIEDPYALILWTGVHDIWLLHLNDQQGWRHGQLVKTGTLLGHTGTRGNSTGPHLHFEVTPHGGNFQTSVDPHPWLLPFGSPGAAAN